jgi:hypothetical protein
MTDTAYSLEQMMRFFSFPRRLHPVLLVLPMLLLLAAAPAQAQVCTGHVTLASQADVEAFACTRITGTLFIGDIFAPPDIDDLAPLAGLTTVGGDLDIEGNTALTSLAGLENLTTLGGNLIVRNNAALPSLAGLENLTIVGGGLYLEGNTMLASLGALETLSSLGGSLIFYNNDALTSLAELAHLTRLPNLETQPKE